MAGKNYYLSGEFNLVCDVCSKKIKAHESRHRWDGLIVCKDDWEIRHEQDFVKARQDKITIPFQRPIPTLVFEQVCNLATSSAYANLATADCARADTTYGMSYTELLETTYCSVSARTAIPSIAIAGCAITAYNIDAYF
jgi:hypothetical protein